MVLSYDIFVQAFRDGDAVRTADPGVWRLLEEAWEAPPDEHSWARVTRRDGAADLYAGPVDEPIDSLMFSRPVGPSG